MAAYILKAKLLARFFHLVAAGSGSEHDKNRNISTKRINPNKRIKLCVLILLIILLSSRKILLWSKTYRRHIGHPCLIRDQPTLSQTDMPHRRPTCPIRHVGAWIGLQWGRSVSNHVCWSPMGLWYVSDISPISLWEVSDRSPNGLW